jgi:16S rRNA (cytidine1402-2'-O)-methyltransferase
MFFLEGRRRIPTMIQSGGTLYIVGTPIGNLDDMTFRAIQTLKAVDAIAAEDTRHTGKLLQHFQIQTPQISYHQHNIHQRTPELIERLQAGDSIALVSDAGMPGISDPGVDLIQACIAAEIPVVPIPGPVAAIAALVAAGLPTNRFCFEGFLPAKGKDRRDRLTQMAQETRTTILYEAPHRLIATLAALAEVCGGDRPIVIARELTKRYENVWRGTLAEAIALHQQQAPRGEYTLVLAGQTPLSSPVDEQQIQGELQELLAQGMSHSQASREVAQKLSVSRRWVYQIVLDSGQTTEA